MRWSAVLGLIFFAATLAAPVMAQTRPCELPEASSLTQPSFAKALQWRQCLQALVDSQPMAKPWLDSLKVVLPQAPGSWFATLAQWSNGDGSKKSNTLNRPANGAASKHLALPALAGLLGDLPDLGAGIYAQSAETLLQRGDTLMAALFMVRQVAADSTHATAVKIRLSVLFRSLTGVGRDGNTSAKPSHARLPWASSFLMPAPWHTPASWQALEYAFWEAGLPKHAWHCLERRMQGNQAHQVNQAKSANPATRNLVIETWLSAASRLLSMGQTTLAAKALAKLPEASMNARSALQALTLALDISRITTYPALAAHWASRPHMLSTLLTSTQVTPELRWSAANAALSDGRYEAAAAWVQTGMPSGTLWQDRAQLLQAALLRAQGKTSAASALLRKLKESPQRRIDNGEILLAQALTALQAEQWKAADSLLTAASAYFDAPETQMTLELRQALLLDTVNMPHWLRGFPSSPYALAQKREALGRIPTKSPLYAQSLWTLAHYDLAEGRSEQAQKSLNDLIQTATTSPSSAAGRGAPNLKLSAARALLAYLQEEAESETAIAGFENLLVESQQGVPAEFARERLRQLEK